VRFVTFTLLPAVDVADGRAVRLVQGEAGTETTYGAPRDAALAWQAGGAEWIHLVDLDAAFGRGSNAELLAAVIGELDVNVELSGGIRDDASLERALSTGCARVNLGTGALEEPAWCARAIAAHRERIAVGLDVRVVEDPDGSVQHRLAGRGWTREGGDLWETIARLDRDGCARYIVTDVSKDGMLRGPNVELYRAVTRATTAPVIASGGISAIGDLVVLAEVAATGANLEGSIVGKALYAGRFTLPEALEAMRRVEVARRSGASNFHVSSLSDQSVRELT
jgi:phosphoribosyl isomerase A